MIALMAIGALSLLALLGVGTMISAPRSGANAVNHNTSIADQMASGPVEAGSADPRLDTSTKSKSWSAGFSGLWNAGKAEPQPALPSQPTGPDPRAAARVQSFSCAGPVSPSRMLICTNWDLATADYNLSIAYQAAVKDSRTPEVLRRSQALWLAKVDKLGANTDELLEAYQQRYAEFDGPTAR